LFNGQVQTNSGAKYSGQIGADSFTIGGYASATNASSTPYPDALTLTPVGNTLLQNYTVSVANGSLEIKPKPATDNTASTATTTAINTEKVKTSETSAALVAANLQSPLNEPATNTKSALDLGVFKIVGSEAPGVIDVVFVPNPALPENTIPVVQLPLTRGLSALPDKVINELMLSAGVVTASPLITPGASSIAVGTGGAVGGVESISATNSITASGGDTASNVRVEQTQITTVLANDAPLPTQLMFNPEDNTFSLAEGAELILPLQVKIQLRQGGSVVSEKVVILTKELVGRGT
jgi:hypothetical protein